MRDSIETLEDHATIDTIETKPCVTIVLAKNCAILGQVQPGRRQGVNLLVLPAMPTQESGNATQRYRGKDAALTNAAAAPDPF